jgi:hypothetical protein
MLDDCLGHRRGEAIRRPYLDDLIVKIGRQLKPVGESDRLRSRVVWASVGLCLDGKGPTKSEVFLSFTMSSCGGHGLLSVSGWGMLGPPRNWQLGPSQNETSLLFQGFYKYEYHTV